MGPLFNSVAGAVASTGVQHALNATLGTRPHVPYEPEGISLLIELGLFADDHNYPFGTLIGFNHHEVEFYPPHILQGGVRWWNDAGFVDLGHLPLSLKKCMQRITAVDDDDKIQEQIKVIVDFAITGLTKVKRTYEELENKTDKKRGNVNRDIKASIDALREAAQGNIDHINDTPLDDAVRANYRKRNGIGRIADTISDILDPEATLKMKEEYTKALIAFRKAKVLEFVELKKKIS